MAQIIYVRVKAGWPKIACSVRESAEGKKAYCFVANLWRRSVAKAYEAYGAYQADQAKGLSNV